jgi:hypothetical protein
MPLALLGSSLVSGTSYAGHELDDPKSCLCRSSGDARHGKGVNECRGVRQLPVVDDGNLMGMVTDSELRHRGRYVESTLVEAAMTCSPVVITSADSVEVAAKLLIQNKFAGRHSGSRELPDGWNRHCQRPAESLAGYRRGREVSAGG